MSGSDKACRRLTSAALAVLVGVGPATGTGHCDNRTPQPRTVPKAAPVKPRAVVKSPRPAWPAPPLRFADLQGKARALQDFRGRPIALFFYCGCGLCHKCAQGWSAMQRSGTLAKLAPQTLVVFHGDAAEARAFIGATQLDPQQTVVMADPEGKGSTLYKSEECPRVFVVDPQGRVRYTNNEWGADSYKIPAPLIVARAIDNLRMIGGGTPAASRPR